MEIQYFWQLSISCTEQKDIWENCNPIVKKQTLCKSCPCFALSNYWISVQKQFWRIIEGVSMVCQGYTFFYVVLVFIGKSNQSQRVCRILTNKRKHFKAIRINLNLTGLSFHLVPGSVYLHTYIYLFTRTMFFLNKTAIILRWH